MKSKAKAKVATKSLSKPTAVFKKSPKKPEADDMPGKMKGGKAPMAGKGLFARLKGKKI